MVEGIPTLSALTKQIAEMKEALDPPQLHMMRIPHFDDPELAAELRAALRALIGANDMLITVIDFPHPMTVEPDGMLVDILGYEVCHRDEVVPRYVRRELWRMGSAYPTDLGLSDDRPTQEEIDDHNSSVGQAILARSFAHEAATEPGDPVDNEPTP